MNVSPDADRLVPLLPPAVAAANARDGRAVFLNGRPYGLPDTVRVATAATRDGGTVIAAVAYNQVGESLATLTRALLIGTPLLLALLAGASWLIAGSTLRPVTELRRGAQDVTRTGRPRALPVPEARDEVRNLALTLNDMLSRLGAAQERQRGLVSDTAHELRSPIASIRAQLEVALDHPDGQDWQQTASDVLADTLRLSRLAEDLLALARLDERDTRRPPPRRVDLTGLVQEEVGRYAEARVPVRLAGAGPPAGTGDPDRRHRRLSHLIDNATRYARAQVAVSVGTAGKNARLSVTDDGPGIPAADRERAFGRFTRLEAARSREDDDEGGAGLGLAIVRATAQAHGGSAWLEDQPLGAAGGGAAARGGQPAPGPGPPRPKPAPTKPAPPTKPPRAAAQCTRDDGEQQRQVGTRRSTGWEQAHRRRGWCRAGPGPRRRPRSPGRPRAARRRPPRCPPGRPWPPRPGPGLPSGGSRRGGPGRTGTGRARPRRSSRPPWWCRRVRLGQEPARAEHQRRGRVQPARL